MNKIKPIKYYPLGEERKPPKKVGKPARLIKRSSGRPPALYGNPSWEQIMAKYEEPKTVGRKRK